MIPFPKSKELPGCEGSSLINLDTDIHVLLHCISTPENLHFPQAFFIHPACKKCLTCPFFYSAISGCLRGYLRQLT
jgi:hypothetical protein